MVLREMVMHQMPDPYYIEGSQAPIVVGTDCCQGVADLISDCTQPEAALRPTAMEVFERISARWLLLLLPLHCITVCVQLVVDR